MSGNTLYRAASDMERDIQDLDGLICAIFHMDFESGTAGLGVHAVARAMEKVVRSADEKRCVVMEGLRVMGIEPEPPG
jgi:hypothetical protein